MRMINGEPESHGNFSAKSAINTEQYGDFKRKQHQGLKKGNTGKNRKFFF